MASSSSSSSSKILCYYGCRLSEDRKVFTYFWNALEFAWGEKEKGYTRLLPRFITEPCDATPTRAIVSCDPTPTRATVSIGSKIYCLLGLSRRLLCLDTNHLQDGWTIIPTRMRCSRITPVTGVAFEKFYVMGGGHCVDPWGEVFDPCNQTWEPISSPPLHNFPSLLNDSYFTMPLYLDDDGTGVSRKLLLFSSTGHNCFYVYDVMAKCWIDPPPKLSTNFFKGKGPIASRPIVVGDTVFWFAKSKFLFAYDFVLKKCFRAHTYCPIDPANVVFLHLDGERFCLLSAIGPFLNLYKLRFSKRFTSGFGFMDADISVEGEWCLKDTPSVLLAGLTFYGKLPGDLLPDQLGQKVTLLHHSKEDEYIVMSKPVMPDSEMLDSF